MRKIFCYGDSNTWGHNPDPAKIDPVTTLAARHPDEVRWPNVMGRLLGDGYQIQEAGFCGRTTAFDDPTAYGRNGLWHFEVALRSCEPVDCIIFMLGTNDTKELFSASAEIVTCGMERLVRNCQDVIRASYSPKARIILTAPLVATADGKGEYWYGFDTAATKRGEELRVRYRTLAEQMNCTFFDVNDVAAADPGDGVHLSEEGHRQLGEAMAEVVRGLFEDV